ncbi:MAG: hypothetical protein R3F39_24595 [Myxococcota bacterium]
MSQGAAKRVVAMVRGAAAGEAGARRALVELWRLATVVDLERAPASLQGPPPKGEGRARAPVRGPKR